MRYRVRIAPSALRDAESISEWIWENSPANAEAWFNGLFEVIDSLETMPFSCPITPEAKVIGQEIRHFIYRKKFRIL